MKTIEIFGGGFENKGAELMLRTTIQELRIGQPELRIAVEPGPGDDFDRSAELGLRHIFPTVPMYSPQVCRFLFRSSLLRKIAFGVASAALPKRANTQLGLVSRQHCDALVDISGYAFGDGFSWIKTKNAIARSKAYHRCGKPIIFMPQMFGPFKNPKVRESFRTCCQYATVIYAREKYSFEAVREVIGDDDRLKIAPDITIFSRCTSSFNASEVGVDGAYACLVPNERMLDQGKREWGDSYIERMTRAGIEMSRNGICPVIVIHAGDGKDADLADRIRDNINFSKCALAARIVAYPDPCDLKAFIAGSRFLVGSRFHSLVAAFSSGVPGVALGWAHKYDALAGDFGVPQLQHRGTDDVEHLASLVEELCRPAGNQRFRAIIISHKQKMKGRSEAMWRDVRRLLVLPDVNEVGNDLA